MGRPDGLMIMEIIATLSSLTIIVLAFAILVSAERQRRALERLEASDAQRAIHTVPRDEYCALESSYEEALIYLLYPFWDRLEARELIRQPRLELGGVSILAAEGVEGLKAIETLLDDYRRSAFAEGVQMVRTEALAPSLRGAIEQALRRRREDGGDPVPAMAGKP